MDMEATMVILRARSTKLATIISEVVGLFDEQTTSSFTTYRASKPGILGSASLRGRGYRTVLAATMFSCFRKFTSCFFTIVSFDVIPLFSNASSLF